MTTRTSARRRLRLLPAVSTFCVLACGSSGSPGDATGGTNSGAMGGTINGITNGGTVGGITEGGSNGNARGGTNSGGSGGTTPTSCEIDLHTFENNGYYTCVPNDAALVAGVCDPDFYELGTREVCGNFRLYAYGHDGRIACAYDGTTGNLVGGFLYGIPIGPSHCSTIFAGPPALAGCPEPTTFWCRVAEGGGEGGAAGGTGEGAAGASPAEAGAAGAG